jgi:hypothetical protein
MRNWFSTWEILVKMFVNGECIPFGRASLPPVLSSHLTLEFTVIAPCRGNTALNFIYEPADVLVR